LKEDLAKDKSVFSYFRFYKYLFIFSSSVALFVAPINWSTIFPSLKKRIVGIERT
jgi:hypothetical protein